ncbi:MAG TPA: NYN domain-containing protein [Candidatus Limnocylindria bacterium]
MSKNVAVFVDVANLYYSARGQEVDVDYVALLKAATKGRDLIRAYAYSGLDPENENQRKFIDFLFKNGYKVVHKDIRKFGDGRVKANLDIELVVDLFRLAKRMDIAVIVSGDGDFAPAIRALQDEGVRCEVISFRPNTSSDLIAVADEFTDIMKIASIGRGKKDTTSKGMSAPEMPAKEVTPEFGFREASPSVAAAALAALRDDKAPRTGSTRGRGRGRSRVAAADSEEAPVAAASANGSAEAAAAESEESRRRRRRRGGRGRGRGRHAEGEATAPEPTGEIGWVEVDDISQLEELATTPLTDDAGQEREYTFEEADEATLAELGLLDGGTPAETGAADQATETKPAPRRRGRKPAAAAGEAADAGAADAGAAGAATAPPKGRSRKASTTAGADAPADEVAEKPARRTRAPKTTGTAPKSKAAKASTGAAAADEGEAAAKPRRRQSSTKATTAESTNSAASDSDADGEGQPQGIWQRFRSARGGTPS